MMGWMAPLRHLMSAKMLAGTNQRANGEPSMGEITTIGRDLAKHVLQVHGVDADGATVLRRQLRRGQVLAFFSGLPPCLVGLGACAEEDARLPVLARQVLQVLATQIEQLDAAVAALEKQLMGGGGSRLH